MTGNELITPALRLIGVLQETESASAEQAANGLVTLNDMMADLVTDDVDLGYAQQSDPNAEIGINNENRQALKALLALAFCADYDRAPSTAVIAMAQSGRNKLLRAGVYQTRQEATMTHIPMGEAYSGSDTSILTG